MAKDEKKKGLFRKAIDAVSNRDEKAAAEALASHEDDGDPSAPLTTEEKLADRYGRRR